MFNDHVCDNCGGYADNSILCYDCQDGFEGTPAQQEYEEAQRFHDAEMLAEFYEEDNGTYDLDPNG